MDTDRYHVAVYVKSEADRAAALAALEEAIDYGALVEAYGDDAAIAGLTAREIVVAVVDDQAPATNPIRRSKRNDPILRQVADRLRARARKIELPKAGMLQKIPGRRGLMPRINNLFAVIRGTYEE